MNISKRVALVITLTISIIVPVSKFEFVENWIKNSPGFADGPIFLAVFVTVGTVYNYIIGFWAPEQRLKKFRERRWDVMDRVFKIHFKPNGKNIFDVTANVMVPEFRITYKLEAEKFNGPATKRRYLNKIFSYAWHNTGASKKLKLAIKQGVAGKILPENLRTMKENIRVYFRGEDDMFESDFSEDQVKYTKDIAILIVCPITLEPPNDEKAKTKTVGVLNIVSTSHKLLDLFRTPGKNNEKDKDIFLGKVCDLACQYRDMII